MNLLKVTDVSVQFGGLLANDGVSLEINPGEFIGLIGPNGAGKSTIFKAILGFNAASSGEILFNGKQIQNKSPHKICRAGIATTFQNAQLFASLSVEESVLMGAYNRIPSKREALKYAYSMISLVGLSGRESTRISRLNMFERKKAELAAAIATKPRLLLLDELFAGLVPTEVENMLVLIKDVKEKLSLSMFVVEHVLRVIMSICDRVYVLEYGKLIAQGTPKDITNNPAVIKAYLGEDNFAIER